MNATATRTEAGVLADAVRAVNAEAIEFVEGCAPGAWTHTTAEEGWTLSMARRPHRHRPPGDSPMGAPGGERPGHN